MENELKATKEACAQLLAKCEVLGAENIVLKDQIAELSSKIHELSKALNIYFDEIP